MILPLCVMLAFQGNVGNWNPKEVHIPADLGRIKFQVYAPSKKSGFAVHQALLVWVPRLDEFPGRPGRQAIRLTMKDQDGRVLEVFEVPSIKASGKANIGQIIGQGYLSFSIKQGMSIVNVERERTCIGLISSDLDISSLNEVAKDLQHLRE